MRLLTAISAILAMCLSAPQPLLANGPLPPDQEVAQRAQEFTKTIKKEFSIHATGTVNLVNKYGKIDVKTWDKNRAKIDVTIVVKARSESAAQSVFDRIRIDFTNSDDFVKAETVISTQKTNWWNWNNDNSEFQINYEVFMPESGTVDLTNKYGDTFVAPISGKAKIDVKYGNFRLENVGGELNVNLGYGNGTIVKARNANAEVSYSKINFNDVSDVNLVTKYSKISVDKGADLKADSRYDQFNVVKINRFKCEGRYGNVEIGEAESVIALSRYTDYKIVKLKDHGDFDLQYGGLRIDNLSKGFSNLNLVGKYSDFKIDVEPGASYTLDASTKYAGVRYPSAMQVTFEKDKGTTHEVKGHAGTQNARSTIKATLEYGGLKVGQ